MSLGSLLILLLARELSLLFLHVQGKGSGPLSWDFPDTF